MRSVTSGVEASSKNFSFKHALSRRLRHQPALGHPGAERLVDIFGNDAGARNDAIAFVDQYRRGAGGIEGEKGFTPFPGPFFDQAQISAELAEHEADEARVWTEGMVEQREHEALKK